VPKITCTSANGRNGVTPGRTRVTVKTDYMVLVDCFEVPSRQARNYLQEHRAGVYARRLESAEKLAQQLERDNARGQMPLLVG